jgi:hypothetical protein
VDTGDVVDGIQKGYLGHLFSFPSKKIETRKVDNPHDAIGPHVGLKLPASMFALIVN